MTVKLRRYSLPSIKGEGWAIVVIGSDGYFSTVSDHGNYANIWSHTGTKDFRDFLLSLDDDYIAKKIGPSEEVFNVKRTEAAIREALLEVINGLVHLDEDEDGDEVRVIRDQDKYDRMNEELEHIPDMRDGRHAFEDWCSSTELDEPHTYAVFETERVAMSWVKHVFPRLKEAIRLEKAEEAKFVWPDLRTPEGRVTIDLGDGGRTWIGASGDGGWTFFANGDMKKIGKEIDFESAKVRVQEAYTTWRNEQ